MYELYTDYGKKFTCKVEISGSDTSNRKARLLVYSLSDIYLYEGSIDEDGTTVINLPPMRGKLKEGTSGKLKLEVIVDDNIFTPWTSGFNVTTKKKAEVTAVKDGELYEKEKPTVVVKQAEKKEEASSNDDAPIEKTAELKKAPKKTLVDYPGPSQKLTKTAGLVSINKAAPIKKISF